MNSTATLPAQSSKKATWLKQARQLHLYLGTFFAPSIIFFALTGALQLFGLHQGRPGEAYQPPEWVQKLGSLHKNQNLAVKNAAAPGAAKPQQLAEGGRRAEKRRNSPFTIALKWFFLATAFGLVFTTVLGIYMAFKFNRSRTLIWSLLVTGTAIPGALIALLA
jgi:hypothetical protein